MLDGEEKKPPRALADTFRMVHPDEPDAATAHGFRGIERTGRQINNPGAKIDYIFVSSDLICTEAEIIRDNDKGRYPSDHYPVRATIQITVP